MHDITERILYTKLQDDSWFNLNFANHPLRLYKKPESANKVQKSDAIITIETDDKLSYTAPEVICNQPVTEKADVW